MAISYTRDQAARAKQEGLHLVSLSALGVSFQGPVSKEEADALLKYLTAFLERRSEELKQVSMRTRG